ncbi:MAG: AAA family ATPase, partial [Bacilli bacterium]
YIFYGVPSSGKTELTSAIFEGEHIMISAELGGKNSETANSIPVGDYLSLKSLCRTLCNKEVKDEIGDVIIVDTITKVSEYVNNYILDSHGKEFLGDVKSHGGAYQLIDKYFNQCFDPLKEIGYTMVWVTHADELQKTLDDGTEIGYWTLNGNKRILELIKKEVDNCFFLNRIPQQDGSVKRVLYTDATAKSFGKNKINSPKGEMSLCIELDKDPRISAKKVIDNMREALEGRGKENLTNDKNEVSVYEFREAKRPIEELRNEVIELGGKLSDIDKRDEAIDIMNKYLGLDYNGQQRGLDDIGQDGYQTLELLISDMKEILE